MIMCDLDHSAPVSTNKPSFGRKLLLWQFPPNRIPRRIHCHYVGIMTTIIVKVTQALAGWDGETDRGEWKPISGAVVNGWTNSGGGWLTIATASSAFRGLTVKIIMEWLIVAMFGISSKCNNKQLIWWANRRTHLQPPQRRHFPCKRTSLVAVCSWWWRVRLVTGWVTTASHCCYETPFTTLVLLILCSW